MWAMQSQPEANEGSVVKQRGVVTSQALDTAILILSVGLVLFLVSYALLIWESPNRLVLVFVPVAVIIWSLYRIKNGGILPRKDRWNSLLGILIITVSAYSAYYFFTEQTELLTSRTGANNLTDMVLGGILLVLVVLVTWKTTGKAIPIVLFVFVAYAFLGKFFPVGSLLYHPGLNIPAFMTYSVIGPDGIFGTLAVIGFTLVAIFVFFAGLVQGFGGLTYVINLSRRLTRRFTWGLPQVPVISSMFFGTFSGAAAANVAGTGSFTIPMMKRLGVPARVAAAIESVASSGGQIMPPVMGVVAFLMADFLGVRYIQVVAWAMAPALLFYISTAFAVYLATHDLPISKLPSDEEKALDKDFRLIDGLPIAVALCFLLLFLIYFRSSVLISGMWATVSYLVAQLLLSLLRTKFSLSGLIKFLRDAANGIKQGTYSVVQITVLLCTMGVVAKMLVTTGLSQDLSFLMVDLSGGHLVFLLPLVFIVCALMGMAVSTVVVYILVVILAAPALISYGITPHVAHFVVFYLALLSALTPPVALTVAIASGIAKSPFFRTAWTAVRMGLPLFLLPFVFIFKPEILAANLATTPIAFLQLFVGFSAITFGINSKTQGITGYSIRVLLFVLGITAVFFSANYIVWPVIFVIVIITVLYFMVAKRRERTEKVPIQLG